MRSITAFYTPFRQLLITSMILFANVGLYISITALGAGGGQTSSSKVANLANTACYGICILGAFVAGSIVNVLGVRFALCGGALTYPLFIAGFWIYDRTSLMVPPIVFGVTIGAGGSLLWAAAGVVQFSYADEARKGTYIITVWSFVQAGAAIGSAIALGINFNKREASSGSPLAVYAVWIALMLATIALAYPYIAHPRQIRRKDGCPIAVFQERRTFREEVRDYARLTKDWKLWVIYAVGLAAEISLSFQSTMLAQVYNLRTRSLLAFLVAFAQILAIQMLRPIFTLPIARRMRCYLATVYLAFWVVCAWIPELIWLEGEHSVHANDEPANLDWTDSANRVGPLFAGYLLSGCVLACWRAVVQYALATLSNDPKVTARYAGLLNSAVSLGMTVSFAVTSAKVEFRPQAYWQAVQQFLSLVLLFIICRNVKETSYYQEDDVIVPSNIADILGGRVDLDRLQQQASRANMPQAGQLAPSKEIVV